MLERGHLDAYHLAARRANEAVEQGDVGGAERFSLQMTLALQLESSRKQIQERLGVDDIQYSSEADSLGLASRESGAIILPTRSGDAEVDLRELGLVIRNRRIALGVKAGALAKMVGFSRGRLWVVERGLEPKTNKPARLSKDKLEKVLKSLQFNPDEQRDLLDLSSPTKSTSPCKT